MRNKLIIFDIKYYKPKSAQNQFILTQNSIPFYVIYFITRKKPESQPFTSHNSANFKSPILPYLFTFLLHIFFHSYSSCIRSFFLFYQLILYGCFPTFLLQIFLHTGQYSSSVPVLYLVIGLMSTMTAPIFKLSS